MAKKIYVIGDFGIDHYFYVTVRGISAEAPIPILDVYGDMSLPGMAGNVAANLKSLGADGVILSPSGPLPIKTRVMTSDGVQLARFDVNDVCPSIGVGDLAQLMDADALIVCDYGKGSITDEVVEKIKEMPIPIFVDTKRDPKVWIGSETAILFPNKEEYVKFEQSYNWLPKVVLKLGDSGAQWVEFGKTIFQRPSLAKFVRCVNGAGDTVIAAFASAYVVGLTIPQCLEASMAAAGVVVEKNFLSRTVSEDEIIERLRTSFSEQSYPSQSQDPPSLLGSDGGTPIRGLCGETSPHSELPHGEPAPDGNPDPAICGGDNRGPSGRGIHRIK